MMNILKRLFKSVEKKSKYPPFGFEIPFSEGSELHPSSINGVKLSDSLRLINGQWVKIE